MAWLEPFARTIDAVNEKFGRAVSWLTLALVVVTALVAIMRYSLSIGWVWMQDAYLWLNGIIFMLGAGYTLLRDRHVRVDIFYVARGPRFRAAVDLVGSLIFLLPTIVVVLVVSVPYVYDSWSRFEGSLEAGGLPGVFLLKSVLLLWKSVV